ncbi:MAG: DmsE family decaheme c-type cytochrome [Gammaproteobacteria bacterium]|nr:DmsE family decaheme c-type cytochrome [Gammaproteobacteria bacterium]
MHDSETGRHEGVPYGSRCAAAASVLIFAVPVLFLASSATSRADDPHHRLLVKMQEGEYSRRGADTCIACHDEAEPFPTLEVFRTVHGHPAVPGSPFETADEARFPAGLQCEACHGPIGEHGRPILAEGAAREAVLNFGARGNAEPELQNGMCLACHANYERAHWAGSPHEEAGLACADCHRIHAATDSVRAKATQSGVCTDCHRHVAADALKRSSHPMRDNQLICRDCHDPHGSVGEALAVGATTNETCFQCHAEMRGPFLWEHPPAAEDCSICHVPHGSNQPALLVRRAPQLCQGCHSSVGHRSFPQVAAQLPPGPASEFLIAQACLNCHTEVHGSNHPSGGYLRR